MKYLIGCILALVLTACSLADLEATTDVVNDNNTAEAIEECQEALCPELEECPQIAPTVCPPCSNEIGDGTTVKLNEIVLDEISNESTMKWFTIFLEQDIGYAIATTGKDNTSTDERIAQLDTILELRDINNRRMYSDTGRIIGRNDDSNGYGSRVIFTPTESGIYYIYVSTVNNARGTFRLEAMTLSDLIKVSNKKIYGIQ